MTAIEINLAKYLSAKSGIVSVFFLVLVVLGTTNHIPLTQTVKIFKINFKFYISNSNFKILFF